MNDSKDKKEIRKEQERIWLEFWRDKSRKGKIARLMFFTLVASLLFLLIRPF